MNKAYTAEKQKWEVLYKILLALDECDKEPTKENWEQVVDRYRIAMCFYEGRG